MWCVHHIVYLFDYFVNGGGINNYKQRPNIQSLAPTLLARICHKKGDFKINKSL